MIQLRVVIYVGDNGTANAVTFLFNGISIPGRKGSCTEYGTHAPLIVYKPGKFGKIDSSLVDLTDFLPTIASIAKIPLPVTYGTLDGTVFYPQTSTRQWLYFHYDKHPDDGTKQLNVWTQNSCYKKYDTTVKYEDLAKRNKLFNINLDIDELYPIPSKNQTATEKSIDSTLRSVIRYYALQQKRVINLLYIQV